MEKKGYESLNTLNQDLVKSYETFKAEKMVLVNGFLNMLNSDLITNEIKDAIAEVFSENDNDKGFNIRQCDECGKYFAEGYCIESLDYYCSDECLLKHMDQEQYDDLYDNGNGESYWGDWIYF